MQDLINKIHNADCLEFMKQLPDKSIDLVLTDPPYGIRMARNTNICSKTNSKGQTKKGFYSSKLHETKQWDNKRPEKIYFDEILRISKNAIIFGGNYFADLLPPSRGWIFWDKKEHQTQGQNFADGELVYTTFDKNVKKYLYGWIGLDYVNNSQNDKKTHPTQKPLQLFQMILQDYSNENDLVLDCFSGSGTTAIACSELKRNFICIEKDKQYYEASCQRLENYNKQLKLF